MVATLLLGLAALWLTSREEEPQIVVPLADVMVQAPGLSAAQVERQITTPLEKLLYQIDGVEYVYSMSRPGAAVVTLREPLVEQATGTLQVRNEAVISSRILATIATIPVRAGDSVTEGETLVELDSRELEARLEQQR